MRNTLWPFAKSRRYIHGLDLDDSKHFFKYVDERNLLPKTIPDDPSTTYGNQFLGWDDFLGKHLRPILPFDDACRLVSRMGFTTLTQWKSYFTGVLNNAMPIPNGLTAYPELDYTNQFKGYNDWFRRHRIKFCGIRQAKEFVRMLPIKTEDEWWSYVNGNLPDLVSLPENIPFMPSLVYGRYWQGFENFLSPTEEYWEYEKARDFVRKLGLRSVGQWRDYLQGEYPQLPGKPDGIPNYPENTYDQFISYVDWLYPDGRRWREYDLASYYVSQFNFDGMEEFKAWRRGDRHDLPAPPSDIPKAPWVVYKDSWTNPHAFLNDGKPRFRSFKEAKAFIRPLGLRTSSDWKDYCEGRLTNLPSRPKDIPTNPFEVYFDEYEGIHDFLGVFCY